jgi:site-specific DNA-methyltransferase (adenine-specific)
MLHPTQKPTMVLSELIHASSIRRDLVLDPFAGSGSTLVAARDMGREYLGYEIEARYARAGQQRLKQGVLF